MYNLIDGWRLCPLAASGRIGTASHRRHRQWKRGHMKYEEFTSLTPEEQKALFDTMEEKSILYDDMEAERDSFKSENEKLTGEMSELKSEMKKTKELNFTLARKVSHDPPKSAEDILHEMFK